VSEPKPKSFEISRMAVWDAYRRVKENKGGAGVDGESIAEFEVDLPRRPTIPPDHDAGPDESDKTRQVFRFARPAGNELTGLA
jgi:hypothetical protein